MLRSLLMLNYLFLSLRCSREGSGAPGLLRHDLRGFKYIGCICFPPLSGSDDSAGKHSSLRAEQPQEQNKPVRCFIIPTAPGPAGGANSITTHFTQDGRRARQRRSTFSWIWRKSAETNLEAGAHAAVQQFVIVPDVSVKIGSSESWFRPKNSPQRLKLPLMNFIWGHSITSAPWVKKSTISAQFDEDSTQILTSVVS